MVRFIATFLFLIPIILAKFPNSDELESRYDFFEKECAASSHRCNEAKMQLATYMGYLGDMVYKYEKSFDNVKKFAEDIEKAMHHLMNVNSLRKARDFRQEKMVLLRDNHKIAETLFKTLPHYEQDQWRSIMQTIQLAQSEGWSEDF